MSDPNISTCAICGEEIILTPLVKIHRCMWLHSSEFTEEMSNHYAQPKDHEATELIDRIAQRMTMASHGMMIGGPAILMKDLLRPIATAIINLIDYADHHPGALVPATAFVLSDQNAKVIAELEEVPDTFPEDWNKEE